MTRVHGAIVKAELFQRGIAQKKFAVLVGITPEHLSGVINNRINPSAKLVAKFSRALGIRKEFLIKHE